MSETANAGVFIIWSILLSIFLPLLRMHLLLFPVSPSFLRVSSLKKLSSRAGRRLSTSEYLLLLQRAHGGSQPPVTLVLGHLIPFSNLYRLLHVHGTHICTHTNTLRHTYIDSILEKGAAAKSLSRCGSIPVMSVLKKTTTANSKLLCPHHEFQVSQGYVMRPWFRVGGEWWQAIFFSHNPFRQQGS